MNPNTRIPKYNHGIYLHSTHLADSRKGQGCNWFGGI
jgi:hypothetical protein